MAGQFEKYYANGSSTGLVTSYWTLTPYSRYHVHNVYSDITNNVTSAGVLGVRPSLNLKSSVKITGGDGTKNIPFTLELSS